MKFASDAQRRAVMARLRGKAPGQFVATIQGYRVYAVPSRVLYDYDGMNHFAAVKLGFKPMPGKREILVAEDSRDRDRTIQHEIHEIKLMRDRGMNYWQAHKRAYQKERGKSRRERHEQVCIR